MKKLIKYQVAFTLLEVSIALVVIGLLIGGGMSLMSASSDVSKYKVTQIQLEEVKEGLASYYTQFFRLPCPDTDGDGVENFASGNCTNTRGFLPHVTLGIGGNADAWGERFKYVISPKFVLPVVTPPTACYSTTMREATGKVIINDLVVPLSSANPVMDFAAFAVLSTGKNGRQTNAGMTAAFSNDGGCAALNERERENCNNDSILRTGTPMSDGNTVVFDDMLAWIGDMQLISLLRQTGTCDVTSESTGFDPTVRTNTDFESGATVNNGNFNGNRRIDTSNGDDKVVITGDLRKDFDLNNGNNTLLIKGDITNDLGSNFLQSGTGNDVVRVEGSVYEGINLGSGNDQLEVEGAVDLNSFSLFNNEEINMGAGDDQIRIYGSVRDTDIKLGSGVNTIYIGGSIVSSVRITADGGTGVLYYNSATKPSSSILTLGSGVTIKCKINNAWTDCP